jgi:hypothetical protein
MAMEGDDRREEEGSAEDDNFPFDDQPGYESAPPCRVTRGPISILDGKSQVQDAINALRGSGDDIEAQRAPQACCPVSSDTVRVSSGRGWLLQV